MQPIGDDRPQRVRFTRLWKNAVAPVNRPYVVRAWPHTIRLAEVDATVGRERHAWRRIVHHRRALIGRRDVVVRQAQRMTDLVRAHLSYAGEYERRVRRRGVGTHQPGV